MEGKLFKMVEGYTLSLTGSIDDLYGISNKQLAEDHQLHKLSIKNCDAIANGYDLIKLIEENSKYSEEDWGDGFLFAMNLMSDKKFDEDDIFIAVEAGCNTRIYYNDDEVEKSEKLLELRDNIIESLQQTEWDVEIVMEENCPYDYTSRCTQGRCDCKKPRLDKDGCLILKRK